ncbi:MAG: 50S ribosomal protein L18 [bacterium]
MISPNKRYLIRKKRSKKYITGSSKKPRLYVYRSLKHIYAQLIDDISGRTILSIGSLTKAMNEKGKMQGNIKGAEFVGEELAKKADKLGIKEVIFDRGGRIYHGRVKALAEGARKGGLKF